MATISISGTNKLAERIIGEAEEEALAVRREAEATVREIRQQSDKAVSARRAELSAQRESAKQSQIAGFLTRASLDGKKDALRKKRAVIDSAFQRSYQSVLSLSTETRGKICAHILEREAEGGETVLPAQADRKALESLISAMPQKHLRISQENAKIDGGFILLGNGFEKDCSFQSVLGALRAEEETAVYQLLFD